MKSRTIVMATASLAGLAAVAACSSTISADSLQTQINSQIQSAFPGVTSSVTCPDNVKPQTGATFTCTATINGQNVPLTVTQKDDKGNVSYTADVAVIDLPSKQKQLSEQLAAQVPGTWDTACAPSGASGGIYVAAPKSTFTCSVTGTNAAGEAKSGTIAVTVDDANGNLTWELQ